MSNCWMVEVPAVAVETSTLQWKHMACLNIGNGSLLRVLGIVAPWKGKLQFWGFLGKATCFKCMERMWPYFLIGRVSARFQAGSVSQPHQEKLGFEPGSYWMQSRSSAACVEIPHKLDLITDKPWLVRKGRNSTLIIFWCNFIQCRKHCSQVPPPPHRQDFLHEWYYHQKHIFEIWPSFKKPSVTLPELQETTSTRCNYSQNTFNRKMLARAAVRAHAFTAYFRGGYRRSFRCCFLVFRPSSCLFSLRRMARVFFGRKSRGLYFLPCLQNREARLRMDF